jgi:hypothetical protein
MCRQIVAAVVLLYLTTSALAEPEQAPIGPSPYLSIVTEVDRSGQTISLADNDLVPEMREKQVENEITGEQETITETVLVPSQMCTKLRLDQVRVYTAGGKRADVEALKPGKAVATFPSGQKLDRRYLELFKEEVLILVIPADVLLQAWLDASDGEAEVEVPPPPAAEAPVPPAPVVDPGA